MANPVHDPRGALWRVWDLHFHTPSSFDYSDMSVTNEQIVEKLVAAGVSVVAITDHHIIDLDRIRSLQSIAGDRLVFLPGIEVRTELGGSRSVHMVGVLPEDCNLDQAWNTIRVIHKIDQQVSANGNDSVFTVFKDFAKTIHELGGLTVVHAGSKSNSIEEISGSTAFKQALKSDLAREASDLFEIANPTNISAYRTIVFPAIRKELPLVMCSDSHSITDYSAPPCWIKADPSFYGLSQAIYDPSDRVFLGHTPPALIRVRENKTKYMSSIGFTKVAGSNLSEQWFDGVTVPLNPGLVAIIGNKGSGKSAFSESLGLLAGCPLRDDFSFYNKDRFLQGKKPKASHFQGTLLWEDGSVVTLGLADSNEVVEQNVQYIPQNYLETVCNELEAGKDSKFTHQIEQVILSHIPLGERGSHDTLESLLNNWTSEIVAGIDHTRSKIHGLNNDISECERRMQPDYRRTTEQGLESKRRELQVLDATKPASVPQPLDDPSTSPEMKVKLAEVDRLDAALLDYDRLVRNNLIAQLEAKRAIISCNKLQQAVDNFSEHYTDLQFVWTSEGAQAGVALNDVVTYTVDREVLVSRVTQLGVIIAELEHQANPLVIGSLSWRREETRIALESARNELTAPSQAYQKYIEDERIWLQKRNDLIGDASIPGSLAWHEDQFAGLDLLPNQVKALQEKRASLVREVFGGLLKWRDLLEKAFGPVQRYISDHPLMSKNAEFNFAAFITDIGFENEFFKIVHQGKRGSFCRDGFALLETLIGGANFTTADGVLAFIDDINQHLTMDYRSTPAIAVSIEEQVKDGFTRSNMYDLLFCLDYLRPTYSIQWAGKGLDLLSPGERGVLLLVFYLLIDKDDSPLLIDQPEENLDNQTVYKILVPCINEARRRRQIMLVTHNPNLAVVCDADQVISATLATDGTCALSYVCGAIENPVMSEAIVDVLEGTKPAFEKRDRKYSSALTDWLI